MSSTQPQTISAQATASKPGSGELADDQLDKVSGGMGISAEVTAKKALIPPMQTTTGGSIAEGDTINGGDMPSPKTG